METATIGNVAHRRKSAVWARAIVIRTANVRAALFVAWTTAETRTARRIRTPTVAENRQPQTRAMAMAMPGLAAPHQGNAMSGKVIVIVIPIVKPALFVALTTAEITTEMPNERLIAVNILERVATHCVV